MIARCSMNQNESDSITLKNLRATPSNWYAPGGEEAFELELDLGAAAGQVVAVLEIPSTVPLVILDNGRFAMENNTLADGDTISLRSPLAGG
jgi:hypothetical protein